MSQLEIKFRNWIHLTETSKKKTKGSDKKQESEEKTEEKKDVYIVYRIDDETQTIRLQKVKNGKFSRVWDFGCDCIQRQIRRVYQ